MKSVILRISFAVLLPLALSACWAGGRSPSLTEDEPVPLQSDPRVMRLQGIFEGADTLLIPSEHFRFSLTAQGHTEVDQMVEYYSCTGPSCFASDGSEFALDDIFDPNLDVGDAKATLGARDGFDTVTLTGDFDATEEIPEFAPSVSPSVISFGFWGEHGFAAVAIAGATFTGQLLGVDVDGEFHFATVYSVGKGSGTNPSGTGGATWTGMASAASTDTFERREGTATVTIADLARPRVGVAIDVPGFDIGSAAWADMALVSGRFTTGAGGSDYIAGHFHGPDHAESYGVFDTGAHMGVFGAKRDP